jgi:hypothetical protein
VVAVVLLAQMVLAALEEQIPRHLDQLGVAVAVEMVVERDQVLVVLLARLAQALALAAQVAFLILVAVLVEREHRSIQAVVVAAQVTGQVALLVERVETMVAVVVVVALL